MASVVGRASIRPLQAITEDRTDAAQRMLMEADRSLMAWVRTSLSMLSFGFTIYKVLQGFAESGIEPRAQSTPERIGLFLTAAGTVAMIIGLVEYWGTLKQERRYVVFSFARPALVIAAIIAFFGLTLFLGIATRVF